MKKTLFDLFRDLFRPGHTKETTKNMKSGGFYGRCTIRQVKQMGTIG